MRALTFKSILLTAVSLILVSSNLLACKKKESADTQSRSNDSRVSLEGTLVERIPTDSFGFMYFDVKHPAYRTMLESPWGNTNSDWTGLSKSDEAVAEMMEVLSEFGIDPNDPKTVSNVASEAVLFLSPTEEAAPVALLFKAPSAERIAELKEKLRTQLEKKGKKIAAVEGDAGSSGFSVELDRQSVAKGTEPDTITLYLLSKNDLGVFAPSQALAQKALAVEPKLPTMLSTPQYAEISRGLGDSKTTYMYGYLDLVTLMASHKAQLEEMSKNKEALDAVGSVTALAWSGGMDETPFQEVRIKLSEESNAKVGALVPTTGESISKFIPPSPMLVVSLDASAFKPIIEAVLKEQAKEASVEEQMPWLKNLKKIGIALSVTQPGILPIPNISLTLQADDTASVSETLQALLGGLVVSSGMAPDATWKENEVAGNKVQSMVGPMGTSLNLTAKEDVVLLSSNVQELSEILKGATPPAALIAATLAQKRYFTLNVDFQQTAKFMTNMSGVLGMYAPQDDSGSKMLSEESIENVRKMGALSTTLEHRQDMFVLSWRFHKAEEKK